MIILQANKFFYEKGGSERYLFALSRALVARGHRVVDFAMAHPKNLPSAYSRYFVPQRNYDESTASLESLDAALNFVRSPRAARRLGELLDEVTPDVAHLHNIYHQLTPSIIDTLSRRGVPMVMTLHDYKLVCPSYGLFARGAYCYRCEGGRFHRALAVRCAGSRLRTAMVAFESYWQRWTRVYDRVDCFVAPSAYLRSVMLASGMASDRITHVAPLNPSSVAPARGDTGTNEGLENLPARFVAYVGRLSPEKGLRVLLEAMARVPEIPLVVYGEGPEDAVLRRMVAERGLNNIRFAGHAAPAVIEAAMRRASAVILPTLSPENAPMAILEAADAGVPVIVSDRGGLPELAARVGGRVVPAGDVAALTLAVREAWEDREGWRTRAHAAWHDARALHEADAHAASIEAVYARAIARRRAVA